VGTRCANRGKVVLYADLAAQTARVAGALVAAGLARGDNVALIAERSSAWVVGLLGVWRAGACAVLLDPDEPKRQRLSRLERTRVRTVLVDEVTRAMALPPSIVRVSLGATEARPIDGDVPCDPCDGDALVSFEPGAPWVVSRATTSARLAWLQQHAPIASADRVVFRGALGGDASIPEVLWPLAEGATVVIARATSDEPAAWVVELAASQATTLTLRPGELLELLDSVGGDLRARLPALRRLFVGGEPLPRTTLEALFAHPAPDVYTFLRIPEAGGEVAWARCDPTSLPAVIPVGRSAFQSLRIQDSRGRDVPPNIVGELVVAGPYAARPLGGSGGEAPLRTGIRCRKRTSGDVELVDDPHGDQFWRDGRCGSLRAVGDALARLPEITAATVVVARDDPRRKLVAFIESAIDDPVRLRERAASQLPANLLPDTFVPVARAPMDARGQIDRAAFAAWTTFDVRELRGAERALISRDGVEDAAVVDHELAEPERSLHLRALLPDFSFLRPARATARILQGPEPAGGGHGDSVLDGGPIHGPPDLPETLAGVLARAVTRFAERDIVMVEHGGRELRTTYAGLGAQAARAHAELVSRGVSPGDVVLLVATRREMFPAFWGCVLAGAVPAPWLAGPSLTAAGDVARLHAAWRALDCPRVICGSERYDDVRAAFDSVAGATILPIGASSETTVGAQPHVAAPGDTALLLLTSGSTGQPKAVELSHRTVIQYVLGDAQVHRLTEHDVTLCWLPVDHVGGLVGAHIRDVFTGSPQVHAPVEDFMAHPPVWLDWIERYRASVLNAANFALGLVNEHAAEVSARARDLSSLRVIFLAAEPVVARTCRRFAELLAPHGFAPEAMRPAWGMTETCCIFTSSDRLTLELAQRDHVDDAVEVGAPLPGCRLRIVDAEHRPVPEGSVGHLQVAGTRITSGYFRNAEESAKVWTSDGWLITGDLGFVRNGRLTITGREKDVIIIRGLNHSAHHIAAVVNEVPGVRASFSAACAIRKAGAQTDDLAIFFSPSLPEHEWPGLIRRVRAAVVERVGASPSFIVPVAPERIPKTGLGKIKNAELRRLLDAGDFDDVLESVDRGQGTNLVPAWFFRSVWERRERCDATPAPGAPRTLVVLSRDGRLPAALAGRFPSSTCVVRVEPGPSFARTQASAFQVRPTQREDFARLLAVLAAEGNSADVVIHALAYRSDDDRRALAEPSRTELERLQDDGVLSAAACVQAVSDLAAERPGRMLFLTAREQDPEASGAPRGVHGAMRGLLRSAHEELDAVDLRLVDLEGVDVEADAADVAAELAVRASELEAAYRRGSRFVPGIVEALVEPASDPRTLRIVQGGTYLITGGLGGIGRRVARTLVERYGAKVLLLGRSRLDRDGLDRDAADDAQLLRRVARLQELCATGGSVRYDAIDLADPAATDRLSDLVAREGGALHGIFHFAGEGEPDYFAAPDDHRIARERPEVIGAMLRPKLLATAALADLALRHRDAIFVALSSVNGRWGGPALAAYSAANSALDAYVAALPRRGLPDAYVIASSMWDRVGMSERASDLAREMSRQRGYIVMHPDAAESSLWGILARQPGYCLMGIDGGNHAILRHRIDRPISRRGVTAFVVGRTDAPPPTGGSVRVRDARGGTHEAPIAVLPALPRDPTGAIDREALRRGAARREAPRRVIAPRTHMERTLVGLWQDVLNVRVLGVTDDFFELGGYSLLLARLAARMSEALGRTVPVSVVLEGRTIEGVARLVENRSPIGRELPPSIVPLRPAGAQSALFLAPTAFGTVSAYFRFAELLPSDQPVYGLNPPGLVDDEAPLTEMDALAAWMARGIREVQPHGPYRLAGWSGGGNIAYAIAAHLAKQHEEVSFVGLFDSVARVPVPLDEIAEAHMLVAHCERLLGTPLEQRTSTEQLRARSKIDRARLLLDVAQRARVLPEALTFEQFERYLAVVGAHGRALASYTPTPYAGRVTLFRAREALPEMVGVERTLGWGDYARVDVREVPGDHVTMMEPGNVEVLAETLGAALRNAG
jgi:acyl-CoA synthetase (AMP-forming)/AMP-acid ligase II/thioesterase domain-containing protein/NAD(P)-dependent dehydrogenase (short-subunit alcohol dehydrogenase family)